MEGGRVLNLGDRINKADAMKKIIKMIETKFKCKPKIIAVGDNHNDLEMLQNSDIPCLVKNDKFLKKKLKNKKFDNIKTRGTRRLGRDSQIGTRKN